MVRSVCVCAAWFLAGLLVSTSSLALDVKPGLWEVSSESFPNALQVCLTRELLDADISDIKMPEGVECISETREKTPQYTITHTVCTGTFAIDGETRVDVLGPESMSMNSRSVMTLGGQPQTIETIAQYRWLSSDCGDVKPMDLDTPVE